MKMFELLPRPLGSIFRKLTHLTCNSPKRKAPPVPDHALAFPCHKDTFGWGRR